MLRSLATVRGVRAARSAGKTLLSELALASYPSAAVPSQADRPRGLIMPSFSSSATAAETDDETFGILHLQTPYLSGTESLADTLGQIANTPGDSILLYGDLGVGKTAFARAYIRSVTQIPVLPVTSPTFTIDTTYSHSGRNIHHLDLYRLQSSREAVVLGLPQIFSQDVSLVEWPDRLTNADRRRKRRLSARGAPAPAPVSCSSEEAAQSAAAELYRMSGPPHSDVVPFSYRQRDPAEGNSVACSGFPLFPRARLSVLMEEDHDGHGWRTRLAASATAVASAASVGGAVAPLCLQFTGEEAEQPAGNRAAAVDEIPIELDDEDMLRIPTRPPVATEGAPRLISLYFEGASWARRRAAMVDTLCARGWARL